MKAWLDAHYEMTIRHGTDALRVAKGGGSGWVSLNMTVNGTDAHCITIRSREHAEALHFMLGQMLSAES